MALTDAQAKIIAANKKKKEEEQKIAAAAAAKILASSTTKKSPSTILDQRVSSLSGNGLKTPLNYLQEAAAQKITTQDRISAAKRSGAVRGDYQSQWQKNKATAAERLANRRERNSKQTLSEYDSKLDRTAQDRIRDYKTQYGLAREAGDAEGMRTAHALAEQVRARAGYSGGVTGDEFLTADLTDREKLTLNQVGQNKLKMAKLAQKQAFEAKDAKALQEATAEMARIMNAPGYRNKAAVGDTDAHGRSKLPGSPDAQREGERAMAGLKAVGLGIPGSIGALGQVASQAATNNVVDANREYMQDLANRKHEIQAKIDAYENGEYIPPDWEPLGQLKSLLRAAENAERMLESGTVVDPDNWAYDLMYQSNEYAEEFLRGRTGLDRLLAETAMSMGQNLPGIALGLLPIPGAQAAGLGLMAAQAAGSRAYDLEMNGVDASTALLRGLGSGAVEGLTEKIPLDNLAKILKGEGGENVLRTVLTQMGMEGTEEGVAYVANFLLDKIAQDPNAEWSWEELGRNALMGALAGGAFATGGTIAADALSRRQTVQPTEAEAQETAPATPAATQEEETDRILRQTAEAMLSETTQEAAGEPVAASVPRAATVAEEQGEVQQKRTREAPAAVAESATTEQAKPSEKKVKLRRIESIPVEVETVQTVRAEEPATLAAKASTLGENGQKALKAARPAQGVAQYTSDFIRVYNQAFTGTATSRIQAPVSMTDGQVIAAYNSGIRDREESLATAREAVKYATVAGKDSGLVYDDYVKSEMDTTVASEINDISKQLGLRVSMVDSVAGGDANADIQGSVVRIEKGNPNPVRFLFGHEMTHRVQELAPEAYRAFRDFVMQDGRYQAAVSQKVAEYARQGVELTQEAAMDEIAADYAGELIESKDLMKRFVESNRKNTSLLGRMLTALKDMAAKLTGKYKTQVNDAVALLEKAVNEAAVQAKKLERRGVQSVDSQAREFSDVNTRYSVRQGPPPKKTGVAYKVFMAKDGELYPPMVPNPGRKGTPVGVWLNADVGEAAPPSKTGRPQVQGGGKGTNSGKVSLAFRPGWHLGDIPHATQFAKKNPATGKKELFPENFVWAECEYAMDVDYQEEAMSYGYTENGKFRHSYAGLPRLPEDGYYRYRTNPNPDTVPWVITGAMKVKRILTDAETDAICRENGVEPMARVGGPIDLSKFGLESGDVSNQTNKVAAQKMGKGMVYDDGNGHSRYSLKTYREGGRQTLSNWLDGRVKNGDLSREDARDMLKEMDRIYDVCNKYTDVYAPFGKWSEAEVVRDENGDAVFSVVKANSDYPMNMDFSLVCKKRRPLDAVLNSLVEQGLAEKFALNKQSIVVLNDIIRRHGFETACSLCFVDAKRFRVTEVADQFATMYNKLVRSMIPKGKDYRVASFNFGGDKTVKKVSGGIDTMQDSDLNFKEIEKTIRTTGEKSVAHKIAVHLRDNPADRKLVRRGDFISTAGFDRVKKDNPALLSLYNSKKGSAGPKASFSDVQYLSEVLEQRVFKRDAAYAVGGVRIQSFSDYMPRLFFDYAQMIADLAAKKLPAHAYSKEALFVQQFGQTGTKINMSLVPKVVKGGVAPGLDANGDYVWQEGQTFGSAVSDKDNGKAGFDLAVQIQNAEGYSDNCGTIAVGVSDRHIEKMLDDPDIRMIIPYHKSGLNPVVAAMNKIDAFENYTNDQNTRHKGTKKKVENAHFDFNAEFHRLGDAKAAADAYLAWCQEKNYLPKFDKWAGHPNYYKLLIDFSAYNGKGEATPQGDVRIQYPQEGDAFGSLNDLIKQGLEEDALAQAALDKGVQPILDDIAKELPAREAEWADSGKRYSLKGADDYQGLIEKYGSIEPGEKRVREVQVPRQTADDKMVSRTVRTIMEAAVTTEEMLPTIEKLVEQGEFSYEVAGDKEAIAQAEAVIRDKGYQTALVDWISDVSKGVVSKQNTATGWALYNASVNAGDAKTAADVMSRIVYHQRNAAQAVQATRILKKMVPGAQLYAIQRSVQNMQSELVEKYGDKAPDLKIPDELVENFLTAETDEARLAAEEEIYRNIGKQMPSTFIDKWNAWRYLAMLGNFRTHIRNISGNLVFAPFVAAKNVVGVGLETAGSVVSGGKMQRTKGVATPSLLAAGWNDYQNVVDQIMAGGKYDDSTYKRDAIAEGRRIFRFKPLEFLRRLNSWALEKEDGWFAQPHYANALAQYCAANGITAEQIRTREGVDASALDKARAYAIKEAQKATYRDFNQFSDFIGTLGRYDGSNKVRKAFSAAVEGVLPFRKTPANILVRALEYSPVGLIQGAAQLAIGVPRKMNTAADALDHLASGLTGTGLVAAGYFLAKMGLLTAGPDDDEEQAKFDDLTGKQDYSWMRKDGTNFTLDWLAPECIPLLVGADIFAAIAEETDEEEKRISAFLGAMSQITDPLLEMSCLSSLNELFDNLNQFSEDGIQAGPVVVANMVVSYLTQGIPTLLGQGERASEADRMTTYTDKNGELPTDWQYVIGRASARIPKWDYNQIPYIDAWGRTDREDSQGKRILDNFFNPAFSSTFSMDSVETELERLYGIVGEDSKVYPSRADRYFNVNGARVDLTADQYVEYAQRKGQRSYELVQSVVSSPWYASASDAVKGEIITNAYTIANEEAKKALFPEYESKSYVYLDAQEAVAAKIPVVDYLYARTLTSGVASLKDANGETITLTQDLQQAEALLNSGIDLSGEKRNAMFDIVGIGKTVKGYSASQIASELASKRSQAVEQ